MDVMNKNLNEIVAMAKNYETLNQRLVERYNKHISIAARTRDNDTEQYKKSLYVAMEIGDLLGKYTVWDDLVKAIADYKVSTRPIVLVLQNE
jgi:hypothetical protein